MDDMRNTGPSGAAERLSGPPAGKGAFSPLPVLFLAVAGLITFVCLRVDLCADDYFYGTFLQDGFDHFLAQNIEHYQTFNGRVQVHLVLQVVLRLGLPAYALACVAMLLLLPLLGRWAAGLERDTRLTVPLVFLLLFLLIGREVLREGLFWISACFNYLYPCLLVACAAALARLALRVRLPWFLLLCPAAFLCGATTEQCGVFAGLVLLARPLREVFRLRKPRLPTLLLPLFAFGGYLTIFLSPATRSRMSSDAAATTVPIQMEQLGRTLFGEGGVTLLVFVTLGLIFLAALRLPRFPKFGLLALPCALLLAAVRWAPGLSDRGFWSLLLLELFGMLLAAALYFSESYSCQGVLLAAGLGETAILVFTAISGPRVLLPMSLSLCLTGALLAAPMLSALPRGWRWALLTLCTAACVLVFLPTAQGYDRNGQVRDFNLEHIRQSRETHVLWYSMDYDPDYYHTPMFGDGFFWNYFFAFYDIDLTQTKVYLVSQELPPIYAGEQRITSPAYLQEGQLFFPVDQILPALGGSALWVPPGTTYTLGDREIYYNGSDTLSDQDGNTWSAVGKRTFGYYTVCFTEDIMEDCFGVDITFDPQRQAYIAQRKDAPAG